MECAGSDGTLATWALCATACVPECLWLLQLPWGWISASYTTR